MIRTRPVAFAVVALALATAVTGCGESESNGFKEDYNAAVRPLSELKTDVGGSLDGGSGKSNEAIAKEFENLARKARQTRANLAKLDPPDDAREEFAALLSALGDGSEDLGAVAAASREDDPAKAADAAQDLVKSGTRIREAEKSLKEEVDG